MFRRRRSAPVGAASVPEAAVGSTPVPTWRPRVDEIVALLAAAPGPAASSIDDVVLALEAAEADRVRLDAALATLDLDRSTQELKAALRAGGEGPTPEAAERIATLRRRHDSLQALANRREVLCEAIARTVVDLESLAASAVASSMAAGDDGRSLASELDRVRVDVLALAAARAELGGL